MKKVLLLSTERSLSSYERERVENSLAHAFADSEYRPVIIEAPLKIENPEALPDAAQLALDEIFYGSSYQRKGTGERVDPLRVVLNADNTYEVLAPGERR